MTEHLDVLAAVLARHPADLRDAFAAFRYEPWLVEHQLRVAHREAQARGRRTRIHDDRTPTAPRRGGAENIVEVIKPAVIIERRFAIPDPRDDFEPFLAAFITRIVRILRMTEHPEFRRIPSANHVQSEAAMPDMIGGHALLRREHRMDQRNVHGAENGDSLRMREQTRRPNNRLERILLVVGLAAIAAP